MLFVFIPIQGENADDYGTTVVRFDVRARRDSRVSVSGWLGKKVFQLRFKTARKTDERGRLMNEIIAGIQVIKMYTWEKPFAKLIEYARK